MTFTEWLDHIWKNYKTTIQWGIGALLIFLLGRGYIEQDLAQLISILTGAGGYAANYFMKKRK